MSRGTCALTQLDSDYIWPDEPNSVTKFKVFWGGSQRNDFAALKAQDLGSSRHGDKGQLSAVRESSYIASVFLPETFFFLMEIPRGAIS